jgi:magnesium transporter
MAGFSVCAREDARPPGAGGRQAGLRYHVRILIAIFKHEAGDTSSAAAVDPSWLTPDSPITVWVDLDRPTPDESRILSDVFHFHELSIEDALHEIHHPKIESYGSYLYLILHGIDFSPDLHRFKTHDIDFFLSEKFLVTVHRGGSRSIGRIADICSRNDHLLGGGTAALMHRIVDTMVDNYRPEIDKLQQRLDKIEAEIFEKPDPKLARRILDLKRDVASLRQVVLPQRDALARLARREFPFITEPLAYRFRDVHDHLVRLSDESLFFQDRISGILDAHLSAVSNQLNSVMKVLTIIATVFMPLTVLTGMWGMNVPLPHLPGGEAAQFWWVAAVMLALGGGMLWFFRRQRWL